MVNAVSMDNVEHAYAVQQLRKSGKNAKIVSMTWDTSRFPCTCFTCFILCAVKKTMIFVSYIKIICFFLDYSPEKEGADPCFTFGGQRDHVRARGRG